jgi:hypothetical protein
LVLSVLASADLSERTDVVVTTVNFDPYADNIDMPGAEYREFPFVAPFPSEEQAWPWIPRRGVRT